MQIKLNQNLSTPFGKLKQGEVINIETDSDGVPLIKFWRNRVKDSVIDNCISIIEEKTDSDGESVSNNKNKKNK